MATEQITIEVDSDAARAYRSASAEEQKKIQALVGLNIREVTSPDVPLQQVMTEISRKAQERGLTPDMLQSLLDG